MVFTKDQRSDIKKIICECFQDKKFMESIADKLSELVSEKLSEKIIELESKVDIVKMDMSQLADANRNLQLKVDQLTEENHKCQAEIDDLHQVKKLSNLRIYGVEQEKDENVGEIVRNLFTRKLSLQLSDFEIKNCYRINANSQIGNKKHCPIIVKFSSSDDCVKILSNKKKLKGSNITITEDLTKSRYEVFIKARGICGRQNVWSQGGRICILFDGKKHYLRSYAEFRKILSL